MSYDLTVRDQYIRIKLNMSLLKAQLEVLQKECEHTFAKRQYGTSRCDDCGKVWQGG